MTVNNIIEEQGTYARNRERSGNDCRSRDIAESAATGPTTLPRNNKVYGNKNYWDDRFQIEESFDWLLSYQQLSPQIETAIRSSKHANNSNPYDARILVVGCGNSPFSADLYDAGYHNVVNIDYSEPVIERMRDRHEKSRPGMEWIVMDMTRMDAFPDGSFDCVIDKAAMDAILVREGDVWNPDPSVVEMAYAMCEHIARILRDGGLFVQISLAQPHFRKKYLLGQHLTATSSTPVTRQNSDPETDFSNVNKNYSAKFGWTVSSDIAGRKDDAGCFGHYLYNMTKLSPARQMEIFFPRA
jgi:SAM-dependent methyltransferase